MSTTTVQPELVAAEPVAAAVAKRRPRALATEPVQPQNEWLGTLERLASNPDVDLTKIEQLIALKERTDKSAAEAAFNAAYAKMQAELPEVEERGTADRSGASGTGGTYKYARFEDIMKAVRPIMGRYGFGIRFEHTVEGSNLVCTGILSHEAGHSIRDRFVAAPDSGGNKPAIQANGSTRSYGQRYTLIALLGIATKGIDNDGATSQAPDGPDGFDDWFDDMNSLASEGWAKLSAAWNTAKPSYKNHVSRHRVAEWNSMKARAQKVVERA